MEKKDSIAKAAAFIKSQTETIDTIIKSATGESETPVAV